MTNAGCYVRGMVGGDDSVFGELVARALEAPRDGEDRRRRIGALHAIGDHVAVGALVELSRDRDGSVRDRATFGLGAMVDRDTPQVREALAARLGDTEADTHEEAICGLAARGDPRAMQPLLDLLQTHEGAALDEALFQLTAHTGDPRLCAHVARRRRDAQRRGVPHARPRGLGDDALLAAVQRCGLTPSAS
jgi:hypothetical protein